jgi:RimJ/RimL family protein N-acetyltransferase
MENPFLIGERTYLRPLERADAATVMPWFNDPEVTRNLGRFRPMNLPAQEAFIDKIREWEHDLVLAIVAREGDTLIGCTGLHNVNCQSRVAMLGICIGEKSEWNKGHGTEATALLCGWGFETLNLNRIWLTVNARNEGAIRCYEKVGFRREGLLRQELYREGRYWDAVFMAILREEWK